MRAGLDLGVCESSVFVCSRRRCDVDDCGKAIFMGAFVVDGIERGDIVIEMLLLLLADRRFEDNRIAGLHVIDLLDPKLRIR